MPLPVHAGSLPPAPRSASKFSAATRLGAHPQVVGVKERPVRAPGLQRRALAVVGRVPSPGVGRPSHDENCYPPGPCLVGDASHPYHGRVKDENSPSPARGDRTDLTTGVFFRRYAAQPPAAKTHSRRGLPSSPNKSQTSACDSDSTARSAGFQPAVSPNFIRQTVRGRRDPQIENLRYSRLKTCATSFRDPMVQRGW